MSWSGKGGLGRGIMREFCCCGGGEGQDAKTVKSDMMKSTSRRSRVGSRVDESRRSNETISEAEELDSADAFGRVIREDEFMEWSQSQVCVAWALDVRWSRDVEPTFASRRRWP